MDKGRGDISGVMSVTSSSLRENVARAAELDITSRALFRFVVELPPNCGLRRDGGKPKAHVLAYFRTRIHTHTYTYTHARTRTHTT